MESVNKKVILMAIIMALITTSLVYFYIRKMTARSESTEDINAFVAAETLPARHKITNDDIKAVKVSKESLNGNAVLNKSEIIGKRTKDRIIQGEQILNDRLATDDKMNLAYNVPEGKRAVSINVNEQIDVSSLIRPGDSVDVIASFDKEELEDRSSKIVYPRVTRIIIQNIEVLAMGQEQVIKGEKIAEPHKTVTLAVTPEDAEKLVYISDYAVIRLALRPAGDDSIVNTPGTVRNDIATEKGVKILPK